VCGSTGTCRSACTTVIDCVSPATCDTAGKCVSSPAADAGSSGGCSVVRATAPDARGQIAWLAAALGLMLAHRRRARAS
jgi:MYXO-CTERM domain-containing protein